jgi:diadenosine tetraphosphate (Ap4A) HIT family hydrolase
MGGFEIDPRISAETILLGHMTLCELRLVDDMRWQWLILVPRVPQVTELHELDSEQLSELAREIAATAGTLQALTGCDKLNYGALGNVVSQLHIHVVARNRGDENWPGPIWGHGVPLRYDKEAGLKFGRRVAVAVLGKADIGGD